MYLILLGLGVGIVCGIVTGLIPGIHVNLIAAFVVSIAPVIIGVSGILPAITFIVAMATTHTFLDVIPSIFLGAPEAATALGVLPGHRYLLIGHGLMAVKLTIIGSLGALSLGALLFFPLIPLVLFVYPSIKMIMGYLLLAIVLYMIFRDRHKFWAATIFLLSGFLGYLVLNTGSIENPLFPLLSGLFGIATLLYGLNDSQSIPEQKQLEYTDIRAKHSLQAIMSGSFSGFITAVLPGVGAGTAAVLSMQLTPKIGDHGFMVLMGGISTANFVLSLVTLQAIQKARNGALVAVTQLLPDLSLHIILVLLCTAMIAGGIAACLTLVIGRKAAVLLGNIPYQKLLISIIVLIILFAIVLSGWRGIIVLITATAIGLLPALKKTSRTAAMGCLLIPVMTYFF